jgi:hypothetical protein
MSTQVNDPKAPRPKGTTTRLVGTIMKEPEQKTSAGGRAYLKFPILIDPGLPDVKGTWWNAVVMGELVELVGAGFFSKHRYAKFTGLGTPNKSWTGKDGKAGTSNEILVTAIELQDGSFVNTKKPGSGNDEDAPF